MYLKQLFFSILVLGSLLNANAQDPQLSQFYAAPLYLNPGFTGTSEGNRVALVNRIQWPGLSQAFNTYTFSFDKSVDHLNSGFGVFLMADKMGSANLTTFNGSFNYSYKLKISDKIMFSPGISFGVVRRQLDAQKLLFGDQLDFDNVTPGTSDPIIRDIRPVTFMDFGTGLLVYSRQFWGGISVSHMNSPSYSLTGEDIRLPAKLTVHGGVKLKIGEPKSRQAEPVSLLPSFIYRKQGRYDQLDVGAQLNYLPIKIGFWYRGIPIQQEIEDNINHDAVVLMFGIEINKLHFGYSYDITVSELGPRAGGSHEVSVIYDFPTFSRGKITRKEKFMPCPRF
ncbi:PorP/SprF family type IX secretion system membrane protein [Mangrovivirga cuniculi]|uniref:Type IX secretion system membrane protein, PorP/SprF family n=1 Tax=Mangrovivirga cuniculi TaxID=2715131 RepID=A0A4D7JJ74_9BACT|nr:type IX secretion system membrane protein PorP/SprF [Mangrovivirga cuniculi]QCK16029.1 hypothetical protein DCC35_15420 [Mangrovivirga cuniculi]